MSNVFVFFSQAGQNTLVQADLTSLIQSGEAIVSIVASAASPATTPALTATIESGIAPGVQLLLSGGVASTSYGVILTVTTNARVLLITCAITVQSQASFTPYTTQAPDAFVELVDQLEAGSGAMATAVFTFPPNVDPAGGYVAWELLADDGTVYAGGNAFDYIVRQNGISTMVIAKSVVSVPTTVPPTADGQRYQLRYTLELPTSNGIQPDPESNASPQSTFFLFENIRVVGLNTTPLGVEPTVEMSGQPATLSLVTSRIFDSVNVTVYLDNAVILPTSAMPPPVRVANGYLYSGVIPTVSLPVTLLPYSVVWNYSMSSNPGQVFQERADLYIVNSTMLSAIWDVKAKINKARTTLYGHPDLLYPEATIMTWLRRGADGFNGAYGQFTNFTMINAKGVIREFWLMYAELAAIASSYLAEGEKAFNFQGAAISLDVDRTSYLDNAESKLQSRIDNEVKAIKSNLIIKGQTSGDGSADVTQLAPGAIGAVGITITPASMWGAWLPSYPGVGPL